jgi:hypothetical protein
VTSRDIPGDCLTAWKAKPVAESEPHAFSNGGTGDGGGLLFDVAQDRSAMERTGRAKR